MLWLASGGAVRRHYDLYRAVENESVAGLNLNAPVKYNGVDVGRVQEIQLAPGRPDQVNLLLAIERGTPVKEDTVATLKTQGLTGIAYLELSGGSPGSPALRPAPGGAYPVIRTNPSLGARLENVLGNLLRKLDSTSGTVSSFLSDENQAAFTAALADIAAVTRTVAARRDALDASLADTARTLENASRASAQIGPVIERLGRSADAIERMGNEVARAGAGAGRTVEAVGADMKRFAAGTQPEIERLLGELNALSASLRSLVEQTGRDPRGLLFGRKPAPAGPGE